MTMSTTTARAADHLGTETRSLLRALLLGSIVELRSASAPAGGDLSLRARERALARLDAGGYGMCDGCGSAIPLGELLASPHAHRCGACSIDASEHRRWRWWWVNRCSSAAR